MKNTRDQRLVSAALAVLVMHGMAGSAEIARFEALSRLPFAENRPTPETADALRDELLFQRATQAYLWALPLVNTLGMKVGSERVFGAGYHVLPVWKKRLDAKTLVTTPNSDVIYAMGYVDLGADGPLVFEAPPGLQGILLDAWQRPIPVDGGTFFGDVGLPGPDAGKGGRFLLVPPGYQGAVPEDCFVCRSATNNVFVFLRAFYQDPHDLAPAAAVIERSRIYPLAGREAARPMQFPDASGVPVNMLPISDGTAFEELAKLVESEGTNLANGQPFPSLGSRDRPAQNTDGSTDLFMGPTAPAGKERNWLATVPGRGYFAVLRLYGPTAAAIEKRWQPGDIEKGP